MDHIIGSGPIGAPTACLNAPLEEQEEMWGDYETGKYYGELITDKILGFIFPGIAKMRKQEIEATKAKSAQKLPKENNDEYAKAYAVGYAEGYIVGTAEAKQQRKPGE